MGCMVSLESKAPTEVRLLLQGTGAFGLGGDLFPYLTLRTRRTRHAVLPVLRLVPF